MYFEHKLRPNNMKAEAAVFLLAALLLVITGNRCLHTLVKTKITL